MNNIHYKNKQDFEKALKRIKSEGFEKLHILADFDRTLTKSFIDGKKKPSIISVLRDEGYLSEDYREKAYKLFDTYHPIEVDPNISMEEKREKMSEWWSLHLDLLIQSGLHKNDIERVSSSENIQIRPGVEKLLPMLYNKQIPLVIMSANGLGKDSIASYLERKNLLTDNIHIISNSFGWNEEGYAVSYDKRVIHSFNKGERVLSEYPEIYEKIKERKNVILLGDSLGDPDMIDGFSYDTLVKIGFLNEKEEELLSIYKEKYDMVLTGDSDASELLDIFQ